MAFRQSTFDRRTLSGTFQAAIRLPIGVSEHFYSLQGEGPDTGCPAVFLRLKGCRLNCTFCDTAEVWKRGKTFSVEELAGIFRSNGYMNHLSNGAILILTGGSPLIQQTALVPFLKLLRLQMGTTFHVAVETEGVIAPTKELMLQISTWVVSLKLASSGEPKERRLIPETIRLHASMQAHGQVHFKFPVADEQDFNEMLELINQYEISPKRVWVMPVAATRAELQSSRVAEIAEWCKTHYLKFSTRLHIQLWDKATGV